MATCLKHRQSYNPQTGEYCPYCGEPQFQVETRATDHICFPGDSSDSAHCRICGRHMPSRLHVGYFDPIETKTFTGDPGTEFFLPGYTSEIPT